MWKQRAKWSMRIMPPKVSIEPGERSHRRSTAMAGGTSTSSDTEPANDRIRCGPIATSVTSRAPIDSSATGASSPQSTGGSGIVVNISLFIVPVVTSADWLRPKFPSHRVLVRE